MLYVSIYVTQYYSKTEEYELKVKFFNIVLNIYQTFIRFSFNENVFKVFSLAFSFQ